MLPEDVRLAVAVEIAHPDDRPLRGDGGGRAGADDARAVEQPHGDGPRGVPPEDVRLAIPVEIAKDLRDRLDRGRRHDGLTEVGDGVRGLAEGSDVVGRRRGPEDPAVDGLVGAREERDPRAIEAGGLALVGVSHDREKPGGQIHVAVAVGGQPGIGRHVRIVMAAHVVTELVREREGGARALSLDDAEGVRGEARRVHRHQVTDAAEGGRRPVVREQRDEVGPVRVAKRADRRILPQRVQVA